jgi:hypothetical protein
MKLLKKVKTIEVKRTFVISDRNKRKPFAFVKKQVLKLSEPELNKILLRKNKHKRRRAYDSVQWYLATASLEEVGLWKGAGGLPKKWTRGSLAKTARFVTQALKHNPKLLTSRSRTAIPGSMQNPLVRTQKERYLLPIVLPGGTMGRWGLKKMKGDIDDGCMRSVALAVLGKKRIRVYFGVQNKERP